MGSISSLQVANSGGVWGLPPILCCPLDGGDIEDIRGNKPKKVA